MTWSPIIETDTGNKSEGEEQKQISEQEFRQALLATLSSIDQELHLLNARFEEAFETEIEGGDVP